MLTKQDIDNMMKRADFSVGRNGKYDEQWRMEALMEVVSKVDAKDPQKIMELSHDEYKKLGLYGYKGYSNVDVATLIFRFATHLQDQKNFDTVMDELKKRGIPEKTFGDAFVIMQKHGLFSSEQVKKVMSMSNGQYSAELYKKIHDKDLFKSSDPFFEYAFRYQDMEALKKYGVDIEQIKAIDTSKEKINSTKYPDNKVRIVGKDGKVWIEESLDNLAFWKANLKLKEKADQQQMQQMNNMIAQDIRE